MCRDNESDIKRNLLAPDGRDVELTASHDAGCHVEDERPGQISRNRDRDATHVSDLCASQNHMSNVPPRRLSPLCGRRASTCFAVARILDRGGAFITQQVDAGNDREYRALFGIEEPEPDAPYGLKGVGEPPTVVSTAAIVSALRAATGRELTRVPVRPDDIVGLSAAAPSS